MRNSSLARAGAAGEHATDHLLGNLTTASSAKLTRSNCIPQHASASAQLWCCALAGTGKGAAKQHLINLMLCALVECAFQCMNRLQANRQGKAGPQNTQELQSMYSEILTTVCSHMYPAETIEVQYQIKKKKYVLVCTEYISFYEPEVCTGYILLMSSIYFKTYISYQYVPCMYSVHT